MLRQHDVSTRWLTSDGQPSCAR